MSRIDADLLASLGPRPRVAVVPTAAGLEDTPPNWARMGIEHFRALGADPAAVMVLDRDDAHDPKWLRAISDADWIYLSGGDPGYLVDTLTGTPFWRAVLARHDAGAMLAGSSAGAMMLGETTFVPRGRDGNGLPLEVTVRAAAGLLASVIVMPHFDVVPRELLEHWIHLLPHGHRMVGIDEDTAIVQQDGGWYVQGKGRAIVFRTLDDADAYTAGSRFALGPLP
jgi:cyanophycinase